METSTKALHHGKKKHSRQRQHHYPNPVMAHRAPPDPTVLISKLDRYPDDAWGGNSVLNRDPRRAEDPNRECSSARQPKVEGVVRLPGVGRGLVPL